MIESSLCYPELRGRAAVITGGAGDLGVALIQGLAQAGVRVAILDLNGDKAVARAAEVEDSTGTRCVGFTCDVLDRRSLTDAAQAITRELGPWDMLINAAGGNVAAATTTHEKVGADMTGLEGTFFDLDLAAFGRAFDLNFTGTVLPTLVLGRSLAERGEGVIVNFSSMNAFRPLTRIPAYSAAKCAVSNFTQWLAVHLGPRGVRVNAIAPGFILTEQLKFLAFDAAGRLTPRYEKVLAHTPMNRLGQPEELVGTLLYLVSAQSRFVTGVTIPVDGGFNAYAGV